MHDGEVGIDAALVGDLIAAQFPHLINLPITAIQSTGTVNAIFRIGDHLCARLPLVEQWAEGLEREWRWLPKLAPHLTLSVPEPIRQGQPTSRFPFSWALYGWIDGEPYVDELVDDEQQAARDLARFVAELRRIEPAVGAPRGGRRPLSELDADTRSAIEAARDLMDSDAVGAAWENALAAPAWTGNPVWIHCDLLRPNLLVQGGRLRAVIDFGGVGVGDPAADVIPAWAVFGREGRDEFRAALDVGDGTWHRARGFALHQAAVIIPYYRQTNPRFVAMAIRTMEQVLADIDA